MGYMATVAILLNDKSVAKMTAEVKEAFEKVFGKPTSLDDESFLYYMRYGKWNEDHPVEKKIMDFIYKLLDGEDNEYAEFCLTGDNGTENHWNNSCDEDRLCLETYISVDGSDADSVVQDAEDTDDEDEKPPQNIDGAEGLPSGTLHAYCDIP